MQRRLACILLLLTLTCVWADSVLTGVIREVQIGDYYHVVVRDKQGKDHSFFVGKDKSFDILVKKPDQCRGKKVRIHWHTITRHIPEAGGKMEIDEATSLEFVK
ncbi:hypothetical protein IV102_32695 [bacterium]|nr:hypothetical protein [bacterium]